MRLRIKHHTSYQYSEPVQLGAHHLYFFPITRNYLTVTDFELKISPASTGVGQRVDAESNLFHQCWFNDPIDHLQIDASIEVETDPINPFNFILEQPQQVTPNKILKIYLEKDENISSPMTSWVSKIHEVSGDSISFLTYLCSEIRLNWEHEVRYEKELLTPVDCFNSRKGSCRDLSWMMIHMLRHMNIPTRFVSGYAFNPDLGKGHELHAWLEAWIDGPGWIGLDPAAGLMVSERYVPVVASYNPALTFPVQGNYWGQAQSSLQFSVEISEVSLAD